VVITVTLVFVTDLLFPKSLMYQLDDIVKEWYLLGLEFGLPASKLEETEVNNTECSEVQDTNAAGMVEKTKPGTLMEFPGGSFIYIR